MVRDPLLSVVSSSIRSPLVCLLAGPILISACLSIYYSYCLVLILVASSISTTSESGSLITNIASLTLLLSPL